MKPIAWQCPKCRFLYCPTCPKKTVGRFFKKLVCPECLIEMQEGGVSWWQTGSSQKGGTDMLPW